MDNNELASLLGTIIGILPDMPSGNEKDQLYRAASKATANGGFGVTFMSDTQNSLYSGYTNRGVLVQPEPLPEPEPEKREECNCPACQLRTLIEKNKSVLKFGKGNMGVEPFQRDTNSPFSELIDEIVKEAGKTKGIKVSIYDGKDFKDLWEPNKKGATNIANPLGGGAD